MLSSSRPFLISCLLGSINHSDQSSVLSICGMIDLFRAVGFPFYFCSSGVVKIVDVNVSVILVFFSLLVNQWFYYYFIMSVHFVLYFIY